MLDKVLHALELWDGSEKISPEMVKILSDLKRECLGRSVFQNACFRQQLSTGANLGDGLEDAELFQVMAELDAAMVDFLQPYFHLSWLKTLNRWNPDWLNAIQLKWGSEEAKLIAEGIDWQSKEALHFMRLTQAVKPLWYLQTFGEPNPKYSVVVEEPKSEFLLSMRGKR